MKTLFAFLGMMLAAAGLWAGEVTVNSGTQATVSFTSGTGGVVTDSDGALSISNSIELLAGCIFYWDSTTVSGGFLGDPGGTGVLTMGKNGNALTNIGASHIAGVIPIANLATGTPTGSKFIRDDGTLAVPSGGSGTVTSITGDGTFTSGTITASGTLSAVANPTFNGQNVTALNATQLTSGTVPAAALPLATTGAFGAVKPDGTTVTVSSGVISAVAGALPALTSYSHVDIPCSPYVSGAAATAFPASNTVYCYAFNVPTPTTLPGIAWRLSSGVTGGHIGFSVYSTNKTLLLDTGPISTSGLSANPYYTTFTNAATTITNNCIFAYTADSASIQIVMFPATTYTAHLYFAGPVLLGTAANASVAGQNPASLGVITGAFPPLPTVVLK